MRCWAAKTKNIRGLNSVLSNNNYNPEKEIISEFLTALGFKKNHTVYLRGFYPSDDSRKAGDAGRKGEAKTLPSLIKIVAEWQNEGRGVYLVVNGGGHADADVIKCRAVFYEHDNLGKEIQRDLWQSLGLPQPSIQVDTGGKSIHSYWLLNEECNKDDWKQLQTDLLNYADADRALKNPSRVMRLAGCFHFSKDGANLSTIISNSGNKYTYQELRNIVPSPKPQDIFESREASDWADMRKIAPYLEGYSFSGRKGWSTCKCPVHNGKSDDSLHVNESTGKFHCHSDCDTKEIFRVSLDIARSKGYVVPNSYSPFTVPHSQPTPKVKTSKSDLIAELSQLIDRELPKSELEVLFSEIAEQSGRAASEIRRVYEALCKEKNLERDRIEVKTQIPEIFKAQQARLNPKELFWGDGGNFADLLQKVADSMPTSVENLITTLIPVAGSRIGTGARIVVNPTARYTQPSIFWSCVVAPTGRLKTPAQEVIISPLAQLEADEFKKWQFAKDDFEEELKRYKKHSDSEPPSPPAPRKRFLVQSATAETRIKLHSENPRGLLNYRDEWSSFINGRNKYRNGKGDDLELDLSEFNGNAILKDNSNDSLFIERSAISRTGNTQPETLQKFLAAQDYEDYTGEFARWLFCLVPGEVAYIELFKEQDNSGELLDQALVSLYRQLGSLREKDYFLTPGAKGVFQAHHRWMTDAEVNEPHPGLRATYPKLKSYLARLCLWLHIINAVLQGREPEQMIEGNTMYIACSLVNFFLNQAKLLYNSFGNGDAQESHLTGELLKIKEYIEKHPDGCTARDIKYGVYCLRKCPKPEVEANCRSLIELKIIKFEDKKYYPLGKKDHQIITFSESLTVQRFEGDDPRSSNDHQDHHFLQKSQDFTGLNINSVETFRGYDTQDDHDDLLMISDHHPQSQTEKDFPATDDHDDLFLEKQKKNNVKASSTTNTTKPIELPINEQFPLGSWVAALDTAGSVIGYGGPDYVELSDRSGEAMGMYHRSVCEIKEPVPDTIVKPKVELVSGCPHFQEGGIYYSNGDESVIFKVKKILSTKDELIGILPGLSGGEVTIKMIDVVCVKESPVTALIVGDEVEIINGKRKGQTGEVTRIDGVIWVKFPKKLTAYSFYSHHLKKVV